MSERRPRRVAGAQPIAARLRRVVYVLLALLILVCLAAIGVLQIQANASDRVIRANTPAFEANRQVLQDMTDAETGLRGYEVSRDSELLAPYLGAHARTLKTLTTLHDKVGLGIRDDLGAAQYAALEDAQRVAVERWWTHAASAEQAVLQGESTAAVAARAVQGKALFDTFRASNAALERRISDVRDQNRIVLGRIAAEGMAATIAVTLAALAAGLILGRRAARALSQPIKELRATMTRQREGEPGARAREDQGAQEIRSLAVDFNRLTEQNLALLQAQERALHLHKLTLEIERAIRSAPDVQHALEIVSEALGEGLGVDRVMVSTVTADSKLLLDAQWHLLDLPDLPPLEKMPADLVPFVSGLAEELWLSTGRLVLHDFFAPEVQSEERARIFQRETGTRAAIMVPIGLGDRVIGTIYLLMVHEPRRWTRAEANAAQQVATFVARAVVEADYRTHQREYIDRLEQLDRQKTDFMSTVSHELRTPLTSISGYLEVLQDDEAGELTEEQHRMLRVIDRNTNRLRSLIDDLLVLNQIESGGLKVNVGPVSMRELISKTAEDMLPLAQSRAIELDIDAGPEAEAAIVQGDRGQLQRAVANIVSNAIKFSHPGGMVTITCTLDEGARRVLLTCQDRGIGIPADDQAQLFTRFYRASNATLQVIPGTGLGLAIVKQIVEDHDGQLRLTSVEGEETTVTVDLPLSAAAPAGKSQK